MTSLRCLDWMGLPLTMTEFPLTLWQSSTG